MTKQEFHERLMIWTALAEQFGRRNSEAGLAMSVNATSDIPLAALRQAAEAAARESRFMPTPAEIREMAGGLVRKLEVADRALLAWDAVLRAIREAGGYRTVEFDDPVIPAVIRMISESWDELCMRSSEEIHSWTRRSFLDAYRAVSNSGRVFESSAQPVPGILAQNAKQLGYEPPKPVGIRSLLPKALIHIVRALTPHKALPSPVEKVANSFAIPEDK